jgi:hypothetical protein
MVKMASMYLERPKAITCMHAPNETSLGTQGAVNTFRVGTEIIATAISMERIKRVGVVEGRASGLTLGVILDMA